MNVPEDALKAVYRRYLQDLRPATRRDCPPAADLILFFSDNAPRRIKKRVLDHLAGCGDCAEEFEVLLSIDRRIRNFSDEVARVFQASAIKGRKGMKRGFLGSVRWALAGAGLAAIALFLRLQPFEALFLPRDDGPRRSGASAEIILDAPRGRVDAAQPVVFRWRIEGFDGPAPSCVVALYDDTLLEIWRSQPDRDAACFLPAAVRESLVSGRDYFWGVSSGPGPSGLESGLASFSVERSSPD